MSPGCLAALAESPLGRDGGFRLLRGWPSGPWISALQAEAMAALAGAQESRVAVSDGEERRGGSPRRRFLSSAGGDRQAAVFRDPGLQQRLGALVGLEVRPSGLAGTFSYYTRPGDFLGIHRDVVGCDVALITCLQDSRGRGHSGANCLWPGRQAEPLSALRSNPAAGGQVLRLEPGDTLVLLGGLVPHAVLPVADGQERVVSLLCFEVVDGTRSGQVLTEAQSRAARAGRTGAGPLRARVASPVRRVGPP